MTDSAVVEKIADCLVESGSTFRDDRKRAYRRAINNESDENARWVLETILTSSIAAEEARSPLCDDTGIPHVMVDVGTGRELTADLLDSIERGVAEGLRRLPGRPMAVIGEGEDRIGQVLGMSDDPADLEPAPIAVRRINEPVLRVHVLMLGGGPAIRGRSYRIFHRHDSKNVEDEIVRWAKDACAQLGCTPCTLAIGIGRSHYESGNLMLQAMVDGTLDEQTPLEKRITDSVNTSGVGPIGMGGSTTLLGSFVKIGPARASGVRIVCMRPCCCFEPRVASVEV